MLLIRKFKESDDAEWLRMRLALWPEWPAELHRQEMEEILAQREKKEIYVVERPEGRLGGFVEVSIRERTNSALGAQVGYIEGWYVDTDLRGQGLGRRLVAVAELWTASHGLTELASDTEIENIDSVRAHERLGFQEVYRLVHFVKEIDLDGAQGG